MSTTQIRRRFVPNHNEVVRGLKRPDLFTVVHEQFFTDTTDYADIVLPATTFFEHKDLQTAYGHYYLQVSDQAIEPLGECRPNVEVFRALAERMGFEDACFGESIDEMIDGALDSSNPWLDGISRERLERETGAAELQCRLRASSGTTVLGSVTLRTFSSLSLNGNFRTPSGKAELYSEAMKALGLDPVAEFKPPAESRHGGQGTALPAGTSGAQGRQLPEFNFFQRAFGAGDGRNESSGNAFRRCPGARNCRRRDGEGV